MAEHNHEHQERWGSTIAVAAIGVALIIAIGVLAGVWADDARLWPLMLWTALCVGLHYIGNLLHACWANRKMYKVLVEAMHSEANRLGHEGDAFEGAAIVRSLHSTN